jgi:hypothetical protein
MKGAILTAIVLVLLPSSLISAQTVFPNRGGTGTSTPPALGQVLVGQGNGTYGPQSTSSLGIIAGDSFFIDDGAEIRTKDGESIRASHFTASSSDTASTLPRLAVTAAFDFLGTLITDVAIWFAGLFDTNFAAKDTDDLAEGGNLYFTEERARAVISETVTGLEYATSTGILSQTSGYGIPLTASSTAWSSFFDVPSTRIAVSGNLAWSGNTLGIASGYVIPRNASTTEWATTFGWGNHATQGYITNLSSFTTTNLAEGTNLYYTNDRADARISAQKGVAGGLATLDGGGKIPVSQLPNAIMQYQGTWNANTNSPTLADGTGSTGDVYRVSVAGTQNLGSGAIDFVVGDYVIYNGSTWEKADTTDAVSSVNGLTGDVDLDTGDVDEGSNLYYTNARADARIAAGTSTIRNMLSATSPITYNSGTGDFGFTNPGYITGVAWGAITGTLSDQTDLQSALNAKQDTLTTGNLTTSATGLQFDNTRTVIGGSAALSLTSGYTIPRSASTTAWNTFYDTPSTRITAGTGLSWSSNTLDSVWTTSDTDISNNNAGRVGIGTTPTTTNKLHVETLSATIPVGIYSLSSMGNTEAIGAHTIAGTFRTVGNFTGIIRGALSEARVTSSNTRSWTATLPLRGHQSEVLTEEGVSNTISGAVNYLAGATHASGTITNRYGFYAAAATGAGTITNQYAFVSEAGAGNVGIGTTSPGSRLTVSGNATIGASYEAVAAPSNGLIVEGNIGIGTTSPARKLQVDDSNFDVMRLTRTGTTANWPAMELANDGGVLGKIGGSAGHMRFYDAANNALMSIATSTGYVGIGTTSPTELLQIQGASGTSGATPVTLNLRTTNNGTWTVGSEATRIDFASADSSPTASSTRARIAAVIESTTGGSTGLAFYTSAPNLTEYMRLDRTGRLGIGTSSPVAKLSVTGSSGEIIASFVSDAGTKFMQMLNTGITTLLGTWDFSDATVKQKTYKSFTWPGTATTTAATSTVPLGTAYTAEAWSGADCWVTSGTGAFNFGDGTNNTNGATATTTVARTTLTTNNTFTAQERRYLNIGPLTAAQLSCTVEVTVNN